MQEEIEFETIDDLSDSENSETTEDNSSEQNSESEKTTLSEDQKKDFRDYMVSKITEGTDFNEALSAWAEEHKTELSLEHAQLALDVLQSLRKNKDEGKDMTDTPEKKEMSKEEQTSSCSCKSDEKLSNNEGDSNGVEKLTTTVEALKRELEEMKKTPDRKTNNYSGQSSEKLSRSEIVAKVYPTAADAIVYGHYTGNTDDSFDYIVNE